MGAITHRVGRDRYDLDRHARCFAHGGVAKAEFGKHLARRLQELAARFRVARFSRCNPRSHFQTNN